MEWIQQPMGEDTFGSDYKILFHMNTGLYGPPGGYDFDMVDAGSQPPWENDMKFYDTENAAKEAQGLDEAIQQIAAGYPEHGHLFMLWGWDFEYQDAHYNYKSMDQMITYMNEKYADKYHFIYSTPSNYVDAVAASQFTFTTKEEDLFPLEGDPSSFWTGYFTSRANAKSYIRAASSKLTASNNLFTWGSLN